MSLKAQVRPIDLPPGRRVLVISDIHGNLPLLKGVLRKAGFCKDDILIILGDIVERNAGSLDTLRYVMELCRDYTVYPVMGNCDSLNLNFFDGRDGHPDAFYSRRWFKLGEKCTLVRMAHLAGVPLETQADYSAARVVLAKEFAPELEFLRAMPHIYVNQDYLFVHGGVPREERLEELDAYGCMKNDDFMGQGHSFKRWVIVGHWPVTLYRGDIPSAAPIVDRERHIVSIDGGCTLKLDGQLNALILPEEPGGEFTWVSYDGFPEGTALEDQMPSADPVNIRWGRSGLAVLGEGAEFCRCRHLETGRELDILTEFLRRDERGVWCEDSTDYLLPVKAGDTLSIIRQTSRGTLCKKGGVTGWYLGKVENLAEGRGDV